MKCNTNSIPVQTVLWANHDGVSILAILIVAMSLMTGCGGQNKAPAKNVLDKRVGNKAAGAAEDDFEKLHNRAIGLMGRYQYAEAYKLFSQLAESRPNDLNVVVNGAIARLNMAGDQDIQAASETLESVLAKEPNHLRANFCLGLLKIYLGPPADPIANFRIVSNADRLDPDAAYLLAQSLEQAKDMAGAKAEYLRCLELNEYYASALLGLSRVARAESDPAAAQNWIAQFEAMKANPNGRVFEFAYKRMGRYGEATVVSASSRHIARVPLNGPLFLPAEKLNWTTGIGYENRIGLTFADKSRPCITPVDLNHDGGLDLLVYPVRTLTGDSAIGVLMHAGNGLPYQLRFDFPWANSTKVNAALSGDVDQNGRVDLYLCRTGINELWLQSADGVWEKSIDSIAGAGENDTVAGLLCDADHDGDLDILCANRNGPAQLINNNRDGSFRAITAEQGFAAPEVGSHQIVAGDMDNDRDLDLVFVGNGAQPKLLLNDRLWKYRVDPDSPAELLDPNSTASICVDIDHDGSLDLISLIGSELRFWKRNAVVGWKTWKTVSLPESGSGAVAKDLAAVDLNGDGELEILITGDLGLLLVDWAQAKYDEITVDGQLVLGWSLLAASPSQGWSVVAITADQSVWELKPGSGRYEFASIGFTGKQNRAQSMRSNRSGIGTRWKARVDDRWITGVSLPGHSFPGQSSQPELIGLNGLTAIDFLAIDWSDGVFQTELSLDSKQLHVVEETQRQLASCPLVFAWNGEKIEFVTDVLGVGGIGFLAAPGVYASPRPWENLWLTERQLVPRDGRLVLKIGEPMEEVCYLQSARLESYDLPAGWQMIVDERMGITDPQPTGDARFFRQEFAVQHARNDRGRDQTSSLRSADGIAADVGELDERFVGLLKSAHTVEFTFGETVAGKRQGEPALAITGWLEYPYSQTVFGAWQANKTYEAATLEVSQDGKQWATVWDQAGYPAGMPRTMLLPLPSGSERARWFRLRTNMQVYWDRISLVYLEACPEVQVASLQLATARLRRVGFAKRRTFSQNRPYYDYSNRSGTWDARHLPGYYTQLGEIRELFDGPGDSLAIFGPGEEVHFEYLAPPPISNGYRRNYVFKLGGWCKDLDLYTEGGDELGPIPFQNGKLQSVPREAAINDKYNWRYESGPWFNGGPKSSVISR